MSLCLGLEVVAWRGIVGKQNKTEEEKKMQLISCVGGGAAASGCRSTAGDLR